MHDEEMQDKKAHDEAMHCEWGALREAGKLAGRQAGRQALLSLSPCRAPAVLNIHPAPRIHQSGSHHLAISPLILRRE
jgi:hypothetical protein